MLSILQAAILVASSAQSDALPLNDQDYLKAVDCIKKETSEEENQNLKALAEQARIADFLPTPTISSAEARVRLDNGINAAGAASCALISGASLSAVSRAFGGARLQHATFAAWDASAVQGDMAFKLIEAIVAVDDVTLQRLAAGGMTADDLRALKTASGFPVGGNEAGLARAIRITAYYRSYNLALL